MRVKLIIPVLFVTVSVAACGGGNNANRLESKIQNQDSTALERVQPIPHYNYSQIRQNLIELETAQANGVQTTSFFFNQGVAAPVQSCPSIGAPIPTTDQLSNPDQVIKDNTGLNNGGGNVTIGQMDPNGVYSGQSSGTYVMCVAPVGKAYADYWEGLSDNRVGARSLGLRYSPDRSRRSAVVQIQQVARRVQLSQTDWGKTGSEVG